MLIVVLPAYNEAGNLGRLLARIEEIQAVTPAEIRVLVVDDGSSDGTAAVALGFRGGVSVEVVTHAENRGLAAAVKTGLETALARTAPLDVIITMDADDTHSPALFPRMLAHVQEGHDLVIASRFTTGARVHGLSWQRRVYSTVARWIFRLVTPVPGVRDYTCAYRAYRAAFLRRVWARYGHGITTESGFSCMADILLKCAEFGPRVVEVPLVLRYDRKHGASKMRVARNVFDTLRLLLRALVVRAERALRRIG